MKFMECDTCSAKPGTPELCKGCLNNRAVISHLRMMLNSTYGKSSNLSPDLDKAISDFIADKPKDIMK